MKKPSDNDNTQRSRLSIRTNLNDARLLFCLVEMLAEEKADAGYHFQKVPAGFQPVETSSIEAYVNGNIIFSGIPEVVNMNFTSSFVFTCSKLKGEEYSFNWLSSLS